MWLGCRDKHTWAFYGGASHHSMAAVQDQRVTVTGRTRAAMSTAEAGGSQNRSRLPQGVAAVQDQVVACHIGGCVGRQQYDDRLQVRHLRQAPRRDLRQPLLGQRAQRLRLLQLTGECQGCGSESTAAMICTSPSLPSGPSGSASAVIQGLSGLGSTSTLPRSAPARPCPAGAVSPRFAEGF